MEVFINAGPLSVDNGATAPLSQYFDLARLLQVPALTGDHYGDDRLEFPDSEWPLVEALLKEAKMLYRLSRHEGWRNVLTDNVRACLRGPAAASPAA